MPEFKKTEPEAGGLNSVMSTALVVWSLRLPAYGMAAKMSETNHSVILIFLHFLK
jgi:hypothetical protein